MTRTHFNNIAAIIRREQVMLEHSSAQMQTLHEVSEKLAGYFRQVNPSFNKEKFMRACGWYGG